MEISLGALGSVVGFVIVWAYAYFITLLLRFGSDPTKVSEATAGFIAVIPSVLLFTDWITFVA